MGNHDRQLEEGIFIGNQLDKGNIKNPLSRAMVNNFDRKLLAAMRELAPESIHEVGCGEARLSRMLVKTFDVSLHGTDFSEVLIDENRRFESEKLKFEQASIYDLDAQRHHRDIVVCCEVMEHLEEPDRGLAALRRLGARSYLLSVPNEPIWRILNVARGKYWSDFGNTPGHLNHWSKASFARFLEAGGFEVKSWLNPFPWLMVVAEIRVQ